MRPRRYAPKISPYTESQGRSYPSGFTEHRHDHDVGLIDMRGRMYDPATRRFVTPDPIVALPYFSESYVVPGEFIDQDEDTAAFMSWQVSVDETMARIEREWTALGRSPTLGEVVWFVDPRLLPLTIRKHPMGKNWTP